MTLAAAAWPVLSAAVFVGAGVCALRARTLPGPALAAGPLFAVIAVDLVPDVRQDLSTVGVTAGFLAILAATTLLAAAFIAARRVSVLGPGWFAAPIAVHGLAEGLAAGAAFSWGQSLGIGVLLALVLHKAAEGADLGVCLASSTPLEDRARRLAWLTISATGPVIGFVLARWITPTPTLTIVATVSVCGLLGRVCFVLVRRARQHDSALRVLCAAGVSGLVMTALIVSA